MHIHKTFCLAAAVCLVFLCLTASAEWNNGGIDIAIPDEMYENQRSRLFRQDGSVALPASDEERCLLAAELLASALMHTQNGEPAEHVRYLHADLFAGPEDGENECCLYLFDWIPGHGFEAGLYSPRCLYSISYDLNQVFGFEGIDASLVDPAFAASILSEGETLGDGTVIQCHLLDIPTVAELVSRLLP